MPASISLCLVAGDMDASEVEARGGFRATGVPLNTRFQSGQASKMTCRSSSRQALAQQVKGTCLLSIILCNYATCLFVHIFKYSDQVWAGPPLHPPCRLLCHNKSAW